MSQPVRLTALARDDVGRIVRWYESQRNGLGREFLLELRKSITVIAQRPLSFPLVYRDTRRALLHRFPYGIFFFEEGESIIACGVLDMRRSPSTWR